MAWGGAAAMLGLSLVLNGTFLGFHDATVRNPIITLGEVYDLTRLPPPLRPLAAKLDMAALDGSRLQETLSVQRLSERVRARLPAAAAWFRFRGKAVINIRLDHASSHGTAAGGSSGCMRSLRDIDVGEIPVVADFVPAACAQAANDHPFRYDQSVRVVRALRNVSADETLFAIPTTALSTVKPGDQLYVSVESGPVRVQRAVRAVQPSAAGRPLFIRGADGDIFAVPAPEAAP